MSTIPKIEMLGRLDKLVAREKRLSEFFAKELAPVIITDRCEWLLAFWQQPPLDATFREVGNPPRGALDPDFAKLIQNLSTKQYRIEVESQNCLAQLADLVALWTLAIANLNGLNRTSVLLRAPLR
jgi:hypothetical protein